MASPFWAVSHFQYYSSNLVYTHCNNCRVSDSLDRKINKLKKEPQVRGRFKIC